MSSDHDLSLADGLTRRRFLTRSSLLAWLATTCFVNLDGLHAALAEAAQVGKPLLSPESLTAWIASRRQTADFRAFVARAKMDLPGALRENFTVTAAQEGWLRSLSAADRAALWNAVDTALLANRQLLIVGGGASAQSSAYHPAGAPPPPGGAPGGATPGSDNKGGKITVKATGTAVGNASPGNTSGAASGSVTVSASWG